MQSLGEHVRKLLRDAAAEAHRRELDHELESLHAAFEQWRRGELTGFELSDRIHRFHQGPNRELYLRYVDGDPLFAVGGAVHAGLIRLDELHPDLRPTVGSFVQTISSLASGG